MATIKDLFKWYLENQGGLVKQYDGKVLVIKDNQVVGSFDNEESAYFDSISKYKPGTFIIQKCTPGEEAYTQTFHSRVSFA
jgi:hypothetical protein